MTKETPVNSAIRIAQRNDPVKFFVIPEDSAYLINTLLAIHEITGLIPSIELIREAAGKVPRVRLDGSILRPGEVVYREPGRAWCLAANLESFLEAFHELTKAETWHPEGQIWPTGREY